MTQIFERYLEDNLFSLYEKLNLKLHPNKLSLRKLDWGIDFLGYIVLPHYILPRNKTKKRIFKKLQEKIGSENFDQSLQSYLGYLSHANSYEVAWELKDMVSLMDSLLDRE